MTLKPIEERLLAAHLAEIASDGIDSYVLQRGRFRLAILHGTWMVNQMRANHSLGILESLILGHGYMAAALMATALKGEDRVGLHIRCGGAVRGVHVEANARGEVRGYLDNVNIPIDAPLESFDTAPFFGSGSLTVTRTLATGGSFSGHIELAHGNIAQDVTRYYAVSEQIPTAMALSVKYDRDGRVSGAGGLLVQTLPETRNVLVLETGEEPYGLALSNGGFDASVQRLENIVRGLPSLGAVFANGRSASEVARVSFAEFDPLYIGTQGLEFHCGCSRERFGRFLAALPEDELTDIKANGPFPLRLTCYNCASEYAFTREEVGSLS